MGIRFFKKNSLMLIESYGILCIQNEILFVSYKMIKYAHEVKNILIYLLKVYYCINVTGIGFYHFYIILQHKIYYF